MEIKVKGKKYAFNEQINGFVLAKTIDAALAKEAIGFKIKDKIYDMGEAILKDCEVEFIIPTSKEAFSILNHSTSHLMAEAIMSLFPYAKLGFGPSIEEGYYYDVDFGDYKLKEEDLAKIEKEMIKFSKNGEKFIRKIVSKQEALEIFAADPYKIELINGLDENEPISTYTQGNFVDLCFGTHVPSTSYIKHFKLLNLAGAYWRGDVKNKQLTRIYGVSFFSLEDLENHLKMLEERKLRDHKKLGKELGLFMLSDYGPGFPFFLPNGMILKNELTSWWTKYHIAHDYMVIQTPIMLSKELWITSGHWSHYKENMYTSKVDKKEFAIKPMNCPGSILVYKNDLHSYKDLPLRYAELGFVHRNEASGALNGLFRVRAFTQDDAHTFIRKDQLVSEIRHLIKLYDDIYSTFGLNYHIELSTRPENSIGDIEVWNESERILKEACKKSKHDFIINPGDGAFYGPKLDFKLKDSMNRIWQCGTIQLDMNLPVRFDLSYIDENGQKVRPIMIHRAVLGSVERFIGIITEHFGGAFPTWLAPVQISVLPVNNQYHLDYAKKLVKDLNKHGFRVKLDEANEKLGFRLRNSQINKIPYTIVVGDKEKDENLVTYRLLGTTEQLTISKSDFIKLISKDIKNQTLPWNRK
ncbi:MAG: threonine--tRNA ligase [Bacilli bacterium]